MPDVWIPGKAQEERMTPDYAEFTDRSGFLYVTKTEGDAFAARYYVGCIDCDGYFKLRETFFPPHLPSLHCESGGHAHCSCDLCW